MPNLDHGLLGNMRSCAPALVGAEEGTGGGDRGMVGITGRARTGREILHPLPTKLPKREN